eukprot:scaffold141547_cov47-Attheya_sp.AAC.2
MQQQNAEYVRHPSYVAHTRVNISIHKNWFFLASPCFEDWRQLEFIKYQPISSKFDLYLVMGILKRIARYLATHPHTPFFYPRNVSIDDTNIICHEYDQGLFEEIPVLNHLEFFQDAGLARDLVDRRSMAAQFHFLFGVATDWKIGRQLATAAHSTDAEL